MTIPAAPRARDFDFWAINRIRQRVATAPVFVRTGADDAYADRIREQSTFLFMEVVQSTTFDNAPEFTDFFQAERLA